MIVFQDLSVVIEYLPGTTILCVRWLEQPVFRMSDFEFSFHILMENIEKFGIKKLITQSSRRMIHLPEEQYISLILLLQSGLAHSKIEKVARISSDQSPADRWCIQFFQQTLNEMQLEIGFRNFDSRNKALAWINEEPLAA